MSCGPWAPGLTAARVLLVLLVEACVAPFLPCCHCGLCDRLDGVQDGGSLPMPLLCPAQQALLRPPPSSCRRHGRVDEARPDMWVLRLRVPKKQRRLVLNDHPKHTKLRTPPTATWLKGGEWATKTRSNKHLLRSNRRSRPRAAEEGKRKSEQLGKKLARPLPASSGTSQLRTPCT